MDTICIFRAPRYVPIKGKGEVLQMFKKRIYFILTLVVHIHCNCFEKK